MAELRNGGRLCTITEMRNTARPSPKTADAAHSEDESRLLGSAVTRRAPRERDTDLELVHHWISRFGRDRFDWARFEGEGRVTVYRRALKRNDEILTSSLYACERTRRNNYAVVRFKEGRELVSYVAEIQRFLLLECGGACARLAICKLWRVRDAQSSFGGDMLSVRVVEDQWRLQRAHGAVRTEYPVEVSSVDTKVAAAFPPASGGQPQRVFFIKSFVVSRRL